MVPTGHVRRPVAPVKACMTDIASNDQITSPATEGDAVEQPELRIGVGTLLGRLAADHAA